LVKGIYKFWSSEGLVNEQSLDVWSRRTPGMQRRSTPDSTIGARVTPVGTTVEGAQYIREDKN